MSTDRVLVTGCAGFIGSATVKRLLELGYTVVGIDRMSDHYDVRIKRRNLRSLLGSRRFHFVEEDLVSTDLCSLLADVSSVIHLAAQAGVRASWGEGFATYLSDNVLATQRLLEAVHMRRQGISRFVYASSSSVYGNVQVLPMQESAPTLPASPYGATKLAGESLTMLYGHTFGIPVTALRYFTVYGPGQRPDMAIHRFIRDALTGTVVDVYGDVRQTRDFTYVDDVVQANIQAVACRGDDVVCNIGGGHQVLLADLLDEVGLAAGRPVQWRIVGGQPGDVHDTASDCTLARKVLGYNPGTGLHDGVAREVAWVRELIAEGL
jgi:UDP-glucose 4-epimerase